LDWWRPQPPRRSAPFTTISHWYGDEWFIDNKGECHRNDKRSGFVPYLDLPRLTSQPLELAVYLNNDKSERALWEKYGWRVRESREVASTPWEYQQYIRNSAGEFSCAKPSCTILQNAWISDRTLCYLASGRPAVVEHTGPSRILPDASGLFRFRNIDEAASYLEQAAVDYEQQSRLARALAEDHFDSQRIATHVLERAIA
jgi:hypothetical protein